MSKNLSELSARQGLENNLFENFAKTDLDKKKIAKNFLIGDSSVTGSMSFYDFLKDENKDKKIYICNGSACLCAGTQEGLKQELIQYFDSNEIGHMTCLGRCHENSAFHYAGNNYSALNTIEIQQLIKNQPVNASIKKESYQVASLGEALLTKNAITSEQVIQNFNSIVNQGKLSILEEINNAQLRGRGGAGFPIGFKLKSAMDADSEQKYMICNEDEGDPGAYSDRYLLEQQPNLVLFGIMVSAYIVGAQYGVLYIRAEYPESISIINQAIDKLTPMIDAIDFDFKFKVISAQGAYICGEETALINSIEGQRPEVRTRPPFPTQQGLFNKPTVVNNVETLASIYAISQKGGAYYSSLGTDKSKGTKLVSLDSFFNKPGIYEVEMGTSLLKVFEQLGGGFKKSVKAVHIGGPLGGVIPFDKLKELTLDFESFANNRFLLGHASVVCIPKEFRMIDYLQHLFEFAAYESCGKCFPCRLGTKRGEELFNNAINNGVKIDRTLLNDLLDTLEQGSLCAHGGGIPLPVKNILEYFNDEIKDYLT
jgi:NADH-quinone oxidoreductase subunit F